ncbi:MAG: HD domain-containing protein [Desulfovibrionaceae bacterium]|nr:HD domain-containing protein [Desulfovibrionaceae bacterium]
MESSRETVIMVDDDITNLTFGKNNLSGSYNVFTAPSGKKMFMLLEKVAPALILLDIEMPEEDGYAVIKKLKASKHTAHIPVIFLTAKIDPESEVKGLNLGAVDYITKPFSPELLNKRVELHILFEKQKQDLLKYSRSLESEVNKKTRTVFELQNAILKTVAELVECRDSVTGGHIERTQHYLSLLVDFLLEHNIYSEELLSWDINLFLMSSQLHDVGKISIKDDILLKQGKLTDEEFEEMKKHAALGVDIIKRIEENTTENEFLHFAEAVAGTHHEKWNGTGYPYGLKGRDIPLQGRLMAIVDVYDALTNDRPYKKAFTHEEAIDIIRNGKGTHFDPLIAEVFLAHEKEFNCGTAEAMSGGGAHARLKSSGNLHTTMKMVANIAGIMDIRSGTENGHMQEYLKIFINALLQHEQFKDEIAAWDMELFLMSAHLHDVGKIAVADKILNKAGKLTSEEYEDVKGHANFGVKIIHQIRENVDNGSLLHHAEALAGSHHEKWDGTGYPQGLKGTGIPLQGRIMAIVDVYEALVNDRPHRGSHSHQEAVNTIKSLSGTHFDPDLVAVFLDCEKAFAQVGPAG